MTSGLFKFFKYFNYTSPVAVKRYWTASISNINNSVILKHAQSGEQLLFPAVWLRDNCLCSSCFNRDLSLRLIKLKTFQFTIHPKSVSCLKNLSNEFVVEVEWPDKHTSVFPLQWLREHTFDEKIQKFWLKNNFAFERRTWNAETFHKICRHFQFDEILASDEILLKWLISLNRWGVAIIKNAGTDELCVGKLADRIGFLKRTTYGKFFIVAAKDDATNAAYLPTGLQLHTDLPYYEYKPSCNFLHFVQQSSEENEGVSQLVDGLEVCRQLKQYDARMYDVLAKTTVEWMHTGKEENDELHHIYRAPVICENLAKDIERINFSQPQRGSKFCVSIEQANDWYKAMNWFVNFMNHPRNLVELKMEEGSILTFVNLRILHGRSAFTGPRKLIGGYMDWDVINSKTRGLLRKLNIKNVNEVD